MLSQSLLDLQGLPPDQRAAFLDELTEEEADELDHDWGFWGRPEQQWRPGPERNTVALCGRGWGKGAMGANAIRWMAANPDLCDGMTGLAGRTIHETNIDLVQEGIMRWTREGVDQPRWIRQDKLLVWPERPPWRGCLTRLFSGDVPKGFRGPNMGFFWGDELPYWKWADQAWQAADMMVRAGPHACSLVTTTPIGVPVILGLIWELDAGGLPVVGPDGEWVTRPDVRLISGSSYENRANLSPSFVDSLARLEGTALGMQEIHGKVLLDVPGALWRLAWIDRVEDPPEFWRVVIGVDPAASDGPTSAETGIVVVGTDGQRFYVLEDGSGRYSPEGWATRVLELYEKWGAWGVVIEDNQGGDMVETPLRMVATRDRASSRRWSQLRIERVRAHRSKTARAAIVCGLWELRKVSHVGDPRRLVALEHQMTHFDPSRPERGQATDRMDALVWAMLYLAGDGTDRGDGVAMLRGMLGVVRSMRGRKRSARGRL